MATTATARAIFDLSRGRQALLSVTQPALGAILATGTIPESRVVIMGLIAATSGYLAVFSLNDVLDRKSDGEALAAGKRIYEGYDIDTAFERHPLAGGSLSHTLGLAWVTGLGAIAALFAALLNPWCLALFMGSVALEVLYCALRRRTWTKTFVSGAMVGLGALAGWVAVAPIDRAALIFFCFLALWEIAGRNLPNDLSDLGPDSAVGLTTVATIFGPRTSAWATLAGAVLTAAVIPFLQLPAWLLAAALLATVWAMVLPAVGLVRRPQPAQAAKYFNRASLLPAVLFVMVLLFVAGGS